MRSGIGYDIHRLTQGRPLILGGVTIDSTLGLAGHSDADVLIHAIIDALLGAASMGDIGELFPDTDVAYKDADSTKLLSEVVNRLTQANFTINNVDTIIIAERPKLSSYKNRITQRLAELLKIDVSRVNVKAKTAEGLGPIGEGAGIAAHAIATVLPPKNPQ